MQVSYNSTMKIKQLGGSVHYSEEMRVHLSRLPREEAKRIVAEIEYRARPRRVLVREPSDDAAHGCFESSPPER